MLSRPAWTAKLIRKMPPSRTAVEPDVAEGAEPAISATTAIAAESTTRRCPLSRIPSRVAA